MKSRESTEDIQARRIRKGAKSLASAPIVNGEGQFVQLTLTAKFAKAFLAELRQVPRLPGVVDVGAALVAELIALKSQPDRLKYMVQVTERVPFMADGGRDDDPTTVF